MRPDQATGLLQADALHRMGWRGAGVGGLKARKGTQGHAHLVGHARHIEVRSQVLGNPGKQPRDALVAGSLLQQRTAELGLPAGRL